METATMRLFTPQGLGVLGLGGLWVNGFRGFRVQGFQELDSLRV